MLIKFVGGILDGATLDSPVGIDLVKILTVNAVVLRYELSDEEENEFCVVEPSNDDVDFDLELESCS